MNHTVLCISGWEALTPLGDKAALENACENQQTIHDVYPDSKDCCLNVPNFETRSELGKKGTRNFDRHTGLVVSTMGRAIKASGLDPSVMQQMGIINGTATGSLSSILDFLLDTFRHDKPYFINPAHMPNTVMNCAAGQAAIWHHIKGPNATLAAGSQSFYSGLKKAKTWLVKKYVSAVMVGVVEEITADTRTLYRQLVEKQVQPVTLAEGCGAFILEACSRDDKNNTGDLILSTQVGSCFGDTNARTARLADLVHKALTEANLTADQLTLICGKAATQSGSFNIESQALALNDSQRYISSYDVLGHGYSAAGVFQFALLLSQLQPHEYGLALSASQNGSMACSVLRRGVG